ncbi:YncE family protein [Phenylobacterium sp.]|uniref:YncE family protein n=1 Tax=Phenylobacterium sp. TaxID=1871053 RepID=UPI002DE95759|nr:YncE family protein [Phenylobacterium sp.]
MVRWTAGAIAALAMAGAAQAAGPGYHVVDKIPGPDGGWDYLRIDAAHNRILIPRGVAVTAIDLATKKATVGLVPGGRQHVALPVDDSRQMLVTNGATDSAIFADAITGATIASVPTGKGPDDAAVDPKSGLAFVMGHLAGDVTLIDVKTHKVVGTIAVGGTLEEGVADGAGRAFVNVENKNEIAVLDIAGRKVTAHWPLTGCDGPTGLAYDRQDKLLIAACDGATALVSATSGKVLQTLPTGKGADGVAYDAKRHLAFVPAGRDGTLSVIAFSKGEGRIAETVTTQRGARTIAVDERTGRIYLPTAEYVAPAGGGRPTTVPGTFQILVVGP